MEKIDQLLHAKWLATCENENNLLENHALAIHQGKIIAILPSKEAETRYEASNIAHYATHIMTPGLINSHTHLAMNMLRGLADDIELMDWLKSYIWPAENKWLSHEMVYDASLLAMAEMIRCGTTCFNDMYFFLDATAEATEKAGMRGFIGMTIMDLPSAWAQSTDEYFAKAHDFYQRYQKHPLITPTFAPHSTYTSSIETLERVNRIAEDYGVKINIHLQEVAAEIPHTLSKYNKRPVKLLNDIGMLSPNVIAIHMTQVNEEDLMIVQQSKPNIVHCPESNMKLASGSCPVDKLLKRGVNVSIGTDGAASNNDLDMLSEIRSAAFLGKLTAQDPMAIPAEKALKMATIDAARALGIDHLTGSLACGKFADLIAIDLGQVETQPIYHPISHVVYAASRHQVTDVWVEGKQLLKNRVLLTLDTEEIIHKAQTWSNKIKS